MECSLYGLQKRQTDNEQHSNNKNKQSRKKAQRAKSQIELVENSIGTAYSVAYAHTETVGSYNDITYSIL